MKEKIGLLIRDITIDEAAEIMQKVREIEQRQSDRFFLAQIKGLEHKPAAEVVEVMKKVFPKRKIVPVGRKHEDQT